MRYRHSILFALAIAVTAIAISFNGTGAADDARTLQALVDKGGLVRLPKGVYRIATPIVVDLEKTGIVAIEGSTVARIIMTGPGPAIRFRGTHAGTAAPHTVKPNVWDQRMPSVDGIEIVGEHPNAVGIEATGTMKLTLTRVLIRDCLHGIHLIERNRNVIVSDCHIYNNRGIGLYLDNVNLHQINVTGSHISYNADGGIVVKAGQVRNLQITGCDIESNMGKDRPPTANILVDSTDGSNAEVAITGNTIQHNHVAAGSANIRIKGPSHLEPGTDERRDGHITIASNILSDVMVNIHLDRVRGVVITGNTFWTAYDRNLLVENCSNVIVGPNNFDRNPRYHREEKPETTNAITFRNSSDCTLTGLHLTRVRAAPAGLTLETCQRLHVTNCTILDCDRIGIWIKNCTDTRLNGCMIRDDRPNAASLAIRVEGGRGNTIVNNLFGRPTEIALESGTANANDAVK